jgi:peroxiredoxin
MIFRKGQLFLGLLFLANLILMGEPALLHADALKMGDEAPDFILETYERNDRVTLSSFRGDRPVVLIFGSYT